MCLGFVFRWYAPFVFGVLGGGICHLVLLLQSLHSVGKPPVNVRPGRCSNDSSTSVNDSIVIQAANAHDSKSSAVDFDEQQQHLIHAMEVKTVKGDGELQDDDDVLEYEFDMHALAEAVPEISLKTAIEAQEKFVQADTNKNMLLDCNEMMRVLPQDLVKALNVDMSTIVATGIAIGCKVDDVEYDFLSCVKIILHLQTQWMSIQAQSQTSRSASVGPNQHANPAKFKPKSSKTPTKNMGPKPNTTTRADVVVAKSCSIM